ncbi:hypothetical protein [Streptomyces sp. URMC 123]|uniref:hypothetical protein n=1 Tax=Streptomyces sp. URMC 123 TaxID=3423403 RepID=UPI003F1C4BAA
MAAAATTTSARAADGLDAAADALHDGPVYVDPRASDRLPPDRAKALADKIEDAGKPVFVAVLPTAPEYPPGTLLQDLRAKTGITGVYAVQLGDRFSAGADPRVMPRNAVSNLTGEVGRSHPGDAAAQLESFVDDALRQANGRAPSSWDSGSSGGGLGAGAAVALVALLAAGGGGAFLMHQRSKKRRAEEERAQLERLRTVVDEDITAFGEELDRLDFQPASPEADDAMREDYGRGLDAYERAKAAMAAARHPDDVRAVTEALEEGRFALAVLAARREGRPLPERRPPCFFDPRHGPSVEDATWAPPGGAERTVPVCAADAARLADGEEPLSRTVETASGRRPYWDAGPAYAPWAGGYFGGGILPGLLMGTMLGSMMHAPGAYAADGGWGGAGGPEGGDYSGADFDPGDFGGGGGFGGGDFGGGGGFGGDF